MIGVLAKLAGQDSSRGMAHWAKLRTHELSQLFHLKRESMPHYSTWSRVLGHGVEPNEVEQIVVSFIIYPAWVYHIICHAASALSQLPFSHNLA